MTRRYCPQCKKETEIFYETRVDCNECRSTGIGYSHEPNSCGDCKGRGYMIVEPFPVCEECDYVYEE